MSGKNAIENNSTPTPISVENARLVLAGIITAIGIGILAILAPKDEAPPRPTVIEGVVKPGQEADFTRKYAPIKIYDCKKTPGQGLVYIRCENRNTHPQG